MSCNFGSCHCFIVHLIHDFLIAAQITPLKLSIFKQRFSSVGQQAPTLQLKYWTMGQQVVVALELLDNLGRPSFAFKHHFVQEILAKDMQEWEDKPMHQAFISATLM